MTDVPTQIGDQYYVTNAVSGAGKSYRLVKTRPTLSAVRVGSTIVVSWPASAAPAGTLKRTGSLAAPIVWTTVSASQVLSGSSYYVTNQLAGGNVFYGLFY
jgi:hypothetical protein